MDEQTDLPPPLEDMTDVINRISQIKAKVDNQNTQVASSTKTVSHQPQATSTKSASTNTLLTVKPKQSANTAASSSSTVCGFGGLKKGFLSGGLDVKKTQSTCSKSAEIAKPCESDIPHLKANPSNVNNHLVMQEVQKMREQLQKTDAWLTEDLLNKLGNNEKLMTMMADPRCERALQEFQTNPDKALVTYQHDKYIQEFFREFCDVLGNHYDNLHEASLDVADSVKSTQNRKTPPTTPPTTERQEEIIKEVKSTRKQAAPKSATQLKKEEEEEARVKQVLSNPQLVEILQSENIMQLIRSLKEDPEQAQRLLQQGGKEFQEKVRVLVDAGLLAFERV